MNRRRTSTRTLGFGSVVLLIAAALVMASAGVFHAYIKNRQVKVSREIQQAELRIAQHELDIKTYQMRLAEEQKRFLVRDRLKEISSDLRPILVVREIDARGLQRPSRSPSAPDLAGRSSSPGRSAVARQSPSSGHAVAGVP